MGKPSTGRQIAEEARRLQRIANDFDYGPPSHRNTERLIDQVEEVAVNLRTIVRGGSDRRAA